MKKIICLPLVILLTGCFGEVGKGYITKECKKKDYIGGIQINRTIQIKSKQNTIENIKIIEKYESDKDLISIQKSKKSEQNAYQNIDGISMDIENTTYTYNINPRITTDDIIKKYSIQLDQHKMIKKYEEEGYKCN